MSSILLKETINQVKKVDREKIDREIEDVVKNMQRNGQYTLLTLDSVTALTAGKARWRELKEQGMLKRMFRSITGKNRSIREAMEKDIFHFQYIAQKMLQELADRQCLTLDIVAAVHNKLNLLIQEADAKFEQIYKHLHAFFEDTQIKLLNINNRIDKVEKKIDLLHWQGTIKRRNYLGTDYAHLTDVEKIVCITSDFFNMTSGEWEDQDLLILETAMDQLGMSGVITFKTFIKDIHLNNGLIHQLKEHFHEYEIQEHLSFQSHLLEVIHEVTQVKLVNQSSFMLEDFLKDTYTVDFNKPVSVRNIVYELLTGLCIIKELRTNTEAEENYYEVYLHQFENPDLRIDIVRELRLITRLPLEECRAIVKNTPTRVYVYESYEEAMELKGLLEKHHCKVEIY